MFSAHKITFFTASFSCHYIVTRFAHYIATRSDLSQYSARTRNSYRNYNCFQKLVVKPDQLIKRRGKLGLIKINVNFDDACSWIFRKNEPNNTGTCVTYTSIMIYEGAGLNRT